MLGSNIDKSITLVHKLREIKNDANILKEENKKNKAFFDAYYQLEAYMISFILARDNFGFVLKSETQEVFFKNIEFAKKIIDAGCVNSNLYEYNKSLSECFHDIQQEWEEFIKVKNRKLINNLGIIKALDSNAIKIQNIINFINSIESWPIDEKKIELYNANVTIANKKIDSMKFDDNIASFISKVINGKASLVDLTPDILEWINSENLADKVLLRIRVI